MDSLRDFLLGLRAADDKTYMERHLGVIEIIKANDIRYAQVHDAGQRAIDIAFTAQQTGLNAALLAAKEAVATALAAAEKAVNAALISSAQAVQKAELASDKRFESVNEFRGTLSDQQRMLMPRSEVEVLVKSLQDKIDSNVSAIRANAEIVNTVIARREGQHVGITNGWGGAVAVFGFVMLILSIIATIITLVIKFGK